jgi:demethylmenaquinone methyltransferase/2-methoxy-6-polyprenyl-1,4-benzoquinol methylase
MSAQPPPDPSEVRRMFDRIAPFYDAMNTLMTAGTDARWRRETIAALALAPGARVLDVATGTGKLAMAAAPLVGPDGSVTGLDASERMLERARSSDARRAAHGSSVASVTWLLGDAMALPFDDASFDAVTIGFGLRNLPDLAGGLREMARVLRPGGRFAVLEISEPRSGIGRVAFATWFRRIIPTLGRLIGRRAAYRYLPVSLERYPAPEVVAIEIAEAGLSEVEWRWLRTGFATLHTARRAGPG